MRINKLFVMSMFLFVFSGCGFYVDEESIASDIFDVADNAPDTNTGTNSDDEMGSLTASVEATPEGGILIAGTNDNLVARYMFRAVEESFEVRKLTIVNDPEGDFGDEVAETIVVYNVTIKYHDVNSVQQVRTTVMSAGSAIFSNLDFYIPEGRDVALSIYVDICTKSACGEELSGKTFRLGVRNVGQTAVTFGAVGEDSSMIENDPVITFSEDVGTFTVSES